MKKGETVILEENKKRILTALDTLEELLEGQEWFSASDSPSIADLSILANFSTIYHVGLDIDNYPNLAAWYERCASLPGFTENEDGAKMFATFLKSKLTEPF
jgi:glutathione S-transferase